MKILKVFAMTMIALLLSGCYTQLQYSQTMRKITDEDKKEAKTYPQNDQVREQAQVTQQSDEYVENESEEYVPIYYKDYDYVDEYDKCNCNPYYSYNFYGDSYFFPSYGSWYEYYRPRLGIGFSTATFRPGITGDILVTLLLLPSHGDILTVITTMIHSTIRSMIIGITGQLPIITSIFMAIQDMDTAIMEKSIGSPIAMSVMGRAISDQTELSVTVTVPVKPG